MLTTKQAATELGIQPGSVKTLCQRGILKAERIGRDWLIELSEIERYKIERRSPGKPKGTSNEPPKQQATGLEGDTKPL